MWERLGSFRVWLCTLITGVGIYFLGIFFQLWEDYWQPFDKEQDVASLIPGYEDVAMSLFWRREKCLALNCTKCTSGRALVSPAGQTCYFLSTRHRGGMPMLRQKMQETGALDSVYIIWHRSSFQHLKYSTILCECRSKRLLLLQKIFIPCAAWERLVHTR